MRLGADDMRPAFLGQLNRTTVDINHRRKHRHGSAVLELLRFPFPSLRSVCGLLRPPNAETPIARAENIGRWPESWAAELRSLPQVLSSASGGQRTRPLSTTRTGLRGFVRIRLLGE
jgi:hypothetical protein